MSCPHGSDTVPLDKVLCEVIEEGLKKGYLCNAGPLAFHFKDNWEWPDSSSVTCGESSYLIRTNVQTYRTSRSENIVFIYDQYMLGECLIRVTYMTYCAGTRIEGQFTWNKATNVISDWQVVTISK